MIAEDKILGLLLENGGALRWVDLAKLNINPVTFARVMRKLTLEGKIEQQVKLTESGWLAKPKRGKRKQMQMPDYGSVIGPPQHVFKKTTDDDIERIRQEAVQARGLVG